MSELLHNIIGSALLFIEGLGVWGILLGLALEVIPSEIVLAYGGYLVSRGEVSLVGAIAFGTIGCLLQQVILYWIGRYGGRPALDTFGKYLHLKPKHLDIAEGWFNRYGPGMVFFARFVPVLRQAISIPAGMARMPIGVFLFYTLLGTIPWAILFVYLGRQLGDNWGQIEEIAGPYVKPLLYGVIVLAALYILWKWLIHRASKRRAGEAPAQAADAAPLAGAKLEGERSTAHQLNYIGGEYRVIHGLTVGSGGKMLQIDHIVIGPNGLFHIDTKHWAGDIRLAEPFQGQDPTAQLYRQEYALKELLRRGKLSADVVGIACFSHPDSVLLGKLPSFTALKPDRLVQYIKTYRPVRTLTPSDVASIERVLKEKE